MTVTERRDNLTMSDKAARKKQFILDTAKGVFAKKGYKDVTMKDIVDACEISRGGLYLYFDNTESIFLSCVNSDNEVLNPLSGHSAGDALAMFLNEQKKAVLSAESNLNVAVYEYLFSKFSAGESENAIKATFEKNVEILTAIIDAGVESEEFYAEDSALAARNIMYTVEGLKVSANTFGVSEREVDMQLLYIVSGLLLEE